MLFSVSSLCLHLFLMYWPQICIDCVAHYTLDLSVHMNWYHFWAAATIWKPQNAQLVISHCNFSEYCFKNVDMQDITVLQCHALQQPITSMVTLEILQKTVQIISFLLLSRPTSINWTPLHFTDIHLHRLTLNHCLLSSLCREIFWPLFQRHMSHEAKDGKLCCCRAMWHAVSNIPVVHHWLSEDRRMICITFFSLLL